MALTTPRMRVSRPTLTAVLLLLLTLSMGSLPQVSAQTEEEEATAPWDLRLNGSIGFGRESYSTAVPGTWVRVSVRVELVAAEDAPVFDGGLEVRWTTDDGSPEVRTFPVEHPIREAWVEVIGQVQVQTTTRRVEAELIVTHPERTQAGSDANLSNNLLLGEEGQGLPSIMRLANDACGSVGKEQADVFELEMNFGSLRPNQTTRGVWQVSVTHWPTTVPPPPLQAVRVEITTTVAGQTTTTTHQLTDPSVYGSLPAFHPERRVHMPDVVDVGTDCVGGVCSARWNENDAVWIAENATTGEPLEVIDVRLILERCGERRERELRASRADGTFAEVHGAGALLWPGSVDILVLWSGLLLASIGLVALLRRLDRSRQADERDMGGFDPGGVETWRQPTGGVTGDLENE